MTFSLRSAGAFAGSTPRTSATNAEMSRVFAAMRSACSFCLPSAYCGQNFSMVSVHDAHAVTA